MFCVNDDPNTVNFSSIRNNYETVKPGEPFFHDNKTLWVGDSDVFVDSARIFHQAVDRMGRTDYGVDKPKDWGVQRREVRIVCPHRGALVGSLYGTDSVTFMVNNSSMEEMVRKQTERRAHIRSIRSA